MTNATSQESAFPEDEDLFDFPLDGAYSDETVEDVSSPADEATVLPVDPTPVAETAPVEEPTPPAKETASSTTESDMGTGPGASLDVDLDEDLFDFESLFDATKPVATEQDILDFEALGDSPSAAFTNSPSQPERKVEEWTEPAPQAQAPAPSRNSEQEAHTGGSTRVTAAEVAGAISAKPKRTTAGLDSIPDKMWDAPEFNVGPEPKRGKFLEILAVSFLLLNTALILLAWRAGDHFEQTLASVTRTVTDAVADGHAQGQLNQPADVLFPTTSGSAGVTPDVLESNVDSPGSNQDSEPSIQEPSDLLDLPQASLELARERIRKGRYNEARRDLFRLLANRDRTALSDEMVIQAETLIAEAFAVQSQEVQAKEESQ